jgi:predicted dehydrogenase
MTIFFNSLDFSYIYIIVQSKYISLNILIKTAREVFQLKIGVIGAGNMGEKHINALLQLKEHVELVGVFDKDLSKLRSISNKYQTDTYTNMKALLSNVDAVSICVPTPFHYEVASECLDSQVHLLIEKPITSTINEAEKLIRKANDNNLIIQVGHIELYNPTFRLLMELLKNEEIIAINFHRLNTTTSLSATEVVSDLMIHDVYLLEEILSDDTIKSIYSLKAKSDNHTANNHVTSLILYTSGIVCSLTSSYLSTYKKRQIEVITKRAYLEADLINHTIKNVQISAQYPELTDVISQNKFSTINISAPEYDPLQMELLDFMNTIKNQRVPKVSAENGLHSLSVIHKILENLQ